MIAIDWPIVFDGAKTVLGPVSAASWPIVVGAITFGFRKPLAALIGRIKTVKGWGASVDLSTEAEAIANQQDEQSLPALPGQSDLTTLPPPDPVLDILDTELRQRLDAVIHDNDALKLSWAIRLRSISEANRLHEFHYRIMFGSQIKALVSLNQVSEGEIEPFRVFYETIVLADPNNTAIHKGRSFDDWGNFLINAGYVALVDGSEPPRVRITPFGRNFCAWLGFAGAAQIKPG